ncbi:MAG: hypothetical protein SFX18_18720 [Pirellulales bacterium]|nr:hypothetical protein [Pirellulales bacterium]
MLLRQSIQSELASWLLPLAFPRTLQVSAGPVRFQAELTAADQLAVAFQDFSVTLDRLSRANLTELKAVAESLSRKLTYLLEPISPIEVDADQCLVQLRSVPPQRDENGSTYYEILVRRGGTLSLVRYHKAKDAPREVIPAQVTREVFARLAEDFANAAP